MRKYIFLLLLLPFLINCSTDFDITAEFYETPVIYGVIEPKKDYQYFRVQKAFAATKDGNVSEMVQDAENIYYDSGEIEIVLKVTDPEEPERPYYDFPLVYSRCDTCKQAGEFNHDYLPLYHTYSFLPVDHESDRPLVADLFFTNLETGHEARASIGLIPCFEVINPRWQCSYRNSLPTFVFDSFDIRLIGPEYARIVTIFMEVLYFEVPLHGGDIIEKTTQDEPWLVVKREDLSRDAGYEYSFKRGPKDFGNYLYEAVDTSNNSEIEYRVIETSGVATFKFILYDNEYYQYDLYTNNLSELQISLAFTNVQDGLGVMASQLVRDVPGISIRLNDQNYWDDFPSLKHL